MNLGFIGGIDWVSSEIMWSQNEGVVRKYVQMNDKYFVDNKQIE